MDSGDVTPDWSRVVTHCNFHGVVTGRALAGDIITLVAELAFPLLLRPCEGGMFELAGIAYIFEYEEMKK